MANSPVSASGAKPPADKNDALTPMLLEFQSPSAALIEQRVPADSRYTLWVLASIFVVMLVLMGTVPIDRVVVSQGKVVATGPGKLLDNGKRQGPLVKKGDTVVYGKYAGTEIEIKTVKHIIVRESELLGLIEG